MAERGIEPQFVSGAHLRLTAIDGVLQQWRRGVMTEDQALRAISTYATDAEWWGDDVE